jgi:hypothetical protein
MSSCDHGGSSAGEEDARGIASEAAAVVELGGVEAASAGRKNEGPARRIYIGWWESSQSNLMNIRSI